MNQYEFNKDLEFLEWLCDPGYLSFLHSRLYFHDPNFRAYLARLQVLAENNVELLRKPEVLGILEIVQSDALTSMGIGPLIKMSEIGELALHSAEQL